MVHRGDLHLLVRHVVPRLLLLLLAPGLALQYGPRRLVVVDVVGVQRDDGGAGLAGGHGDRHGGGVLPHWRV